MTNETRPEPAVSEAVEKKSGWRQFFEKNFLGFAILFSAVMISASVIYTDNIGAGGNDVAKIQDNGTARIGDSIVSVSTDDDAVLGDKDAPVTIIEFSDYQCPFCRIFWVQSFGLLKKEYIDTGKVNLVFRDYPLSFHAGAIAAAESAECAGDQNRYWEMHDKIFMEQEKQGSGTIQFTVDDLKKWAGEIGLDGNRFNTCLDSRKYKSEVEADVADGNTAGVTGTPAFFVNGRLLVGAQPYQTFKAIIEEELNKK